MPLQPPIGWIGPNPADTFPVWNRTGATRAIGDLVQLDLGHTNAETTNGEVGDDASALANATLPETAFLEHGIFAYVEEAAGDNFKMRVRVRGTVDALSVAAATALTSQLVPANGSASAAVAGVSTAKIIAIPLTTTAGAGTVAALFDGVSGFGKAT